MQNPLINPSQSYAVAIPMDMQHMAYMADGAHSHSSSESNKIYRNGKQGWFWPLLLLLLVLCWLAFYLRCCSDMYGGTALLKTEQVDEHAESNHEMNSESGHNTHAEKATVADSTAVMVGDSL